MGIKIFKREKKIADYSNLESYLEDRLENREYIYESGELGTIRNEISTLRKFVAHISSILVGRGILSTDDVTDMFLGYDEYIEITMLK